MELNLLEKKILTHFFNHHPLDLPMDYESETVIENIIYLSLLVGKKLRRRRLALATLTINQKPDQSIVTDIDLLIETFVKDWIQNRFSEFNFLGEETGGTLMPDVPTITLDPIDGTWSFISGDPTYGFSISLLYQNQIILGVVMNPSTGELGYTWANQATRLIQLPCFDELPCGLTLPIKKNNRLFSKILVNLQPSKDHEHLLKKLQNARINTLHINHIKSQGGSPAVGLLDAAKGQYIYIHPWPHKPSTAFDISAGLKLIMNAGGQALDLDYRKIPYIGHVGPFVAGINEDDVKKIISILNTASF